LIFSGKVLQEEIHLKDYGIQRNSTIIQNLRLQGGAPGESIQARSSSIDKGQASFKDSLRGKATTQDKQIPNLRIPCSYIVEKMEKSPDLSIEIPEVSDLFNILQTKAIICRFNGYWPKSEELSEWIYLN